MRTLQPNADRAERRALIALFAVFALLVQALWPVAASAAPDLGASALICTEHGLAAAPDGAPTPAQDDTGHPCQHCVCPTVAAMPPLDLAVRSQPVRYAAHAPLTTRAPDGPSPGRGLAAPPPPGRGPPPVLLT